MFRGEGNCKWGLVFLVTANSLNFGGCPILSESKFFVIQFNIEIHFQT